MRTTRRAFSIGSSRLVALLGGVLGLTACTSGSEPPGPADGEDISGVVTGPNGPEAGVWVIAETRDLGTRFARIVVTDDQGRYVVPDLPPADYDVWVRGYGLVDSEKVPAVPGAELDLTATPAPDERAAAHYYPAGYWFSLMHVPEADEFPGTARAGTASRRRSGRRPSGSGS